MQADAWGYVYPHIDSERCIDCKWCVKSCPNHSTPRFVVSQKAYAAWSVIPEDRETSTSGGVSSAVGSRVLSLGGVIYGAAWSGIGTVEHRRATTLCEIQEFKGSKYVQSNISAELIHQLREDVKKGKDVVFIGTPCQSAGIRNAVGKADNLYCIDLVCHGVPSQQILRDHLRMVTDERFDEITSVSTRDREGYYLTVSVKDTVVYRKGFPKDEYENGFQYSLFNRPSCYQCKYARPERQSDLTIGDFWGLRAENYPHEKVSLILQNTDRGKRLLERCKDSMFLNQRPLEEAVAGNGQLKSPSNKHECYDKFRQLYISRGYRKAIKRSLLKFRIKHFLFKVMILIPGFRSFYSTMKK